MAPIKENQMNVIDAITLYSHIMQQSGGGLAGREAANTALTNNGFSKEIMEAISFCVSNEGYLTSEKGGRFAITQISAS